MRYNPFFVVLCLVVMPGAWAVEVTLLDSAQHFRQINNENRFASGTDFHFLRVSLVLSDPALYRNPPEIAVTAEQQGVVVPLVLSNDRVARDRLTYQARSPWDPTLTDGWTITIATEDGRLTNLPLTTVTRSIEAPTTSQPVNNMRIFGTLDDGFTMSWSRPEPRDRVQVWMAWLQGDANAPIVHDIILPGDTREYLIPPVLNSNHAMKIGETYMIAIVNYETDALGPVASAATYFEFSPADFIRDSFLPGRRSDGTFTFDIFIPGRRQLIYLDPPVVVGYDFAIGLGNPNFASIEMPDLGDGLYELHLFDETTDGWVFTAEVRANELYAFDEVGVDRFRILGIEPTAGLSPDDPTAFRAGVSFVAEGSFTGTMRPITLETDIFEDGFEVQ